MRVPEAQDVYVVLDVVEGAYEEAETQINMGSTYITIAVENGKATYLTVEQWKAFVQAIVDGNIGIYKLKLEYERERTAEQNRSDLDKADEAVGITPQPHGASGNTTYIHADDSSVAAGTIYGEVNVRGSVGGGVWIDGKRVK